MAIKERIPLSSIPAAGNIWQANDLRGGNIMFLSYLAPPLGLLLEEGLFVRKYLSFNPNPVFWGQSKTARVSEIFIDRDKKLYIGFRNTPGMPIFHFTTEVRLSSRILLAIIDEYGDIKKRFLVSYTSEEIAVTDYWSGEGFEKRTRITLLESKPGYLFLEHFPAN
ncbi:hypothetical protein IKW75_02275 [Candidatus Saccharibacteria bacterium]|nr:hypothetical protein [Candidatus Saccharibacteria bacterium]